jgi:hypothetical protein
MKVNDLLSWRRASEDDSDYPEATDNRGELEAVDKPEDLLPALKGKTWEEVEGDDSVHRERVESMVRDG